MFRLALAFPWQWGAGLGGSGPPAPTFEGPFWVSHYHSIGPRCHPFTVRPPVIEPGRRWSDDPTLQTFAWDEDT